MFSKMHRVSAIAFASTLLVTSFVAEGSGAFAQEYISNAVNAEPAAQFVSNPVVQEVPLQSDAKIVYEPVEPLAPGRDEADDSANSLAELVADQDTSPAALNRELNCLAGAIYFEAKSESLEGQLAVGRVIVARSKSGRFPASYCGVVFQRSQFSFVRGNSMPAINTNSRQWRNAAAIAQISHEGSWDSPVEGALFFHATHVSPGWRLKRMARVENHVFYR